MLRSRRIQPNFAKTSFDHGNILRKHFEATEVLTSFNHAPLCSLQSLVDNTIFLGTKNWTLQNRPKSNLFLQTSYWNITHCLPHIKVLLHTKFYRDPCRKNGSFRGDTNRGTDYALIYYTAHSACTQIAIFLIKSYKHGELFCKTNSLIYN